MYIFHNNKIFKKKKEKKAIGKIQLRGRGDIYNKEKRYLKVFTSQ